jgi:anthranilate phosphoribosyltransferase
MREYLQLVATGPELSKSLNEAQAEDGMSMILDRDIDAVRAGIFLIALRMKRESDAENAGILSALIGQLQTARTRSAEILSVADPFNGYLRGLPATPFLPAVFAACGLPAYSHGLQSVGPKYGITTRLVLEQAGKNVDMNVREAADLLDNPDAGWAYLDQSQRIC